MESPALESFFLPLPQPSVPQPGQRLYLAGDLSDAEAIAEGEKQVDMVGHDDSGKHAGIMGDVSGRRISIKEAAMAGSRGAGCRSFVPNVTK